MFLRVLLALLLLISPAAGDSLTFNMSGTWFEDSTPGAFNFFPFFVDNFEAVGGGGLQAPYGGSGTAADPFLYSGSYFPLLQLSSHGTGMFCQIPQPFFPNGICAVLYLTTGSGFFSDSGNAFHFRSDLTAVLDPLFYWYLGLPDSYFDAVGNMEFTLNRNSDAGYGVSWSIQNGSATLYPVPEPATVLLLASGIGAAVLRRRRE